MALQSGLLQPAAEKAAAYSRHLYDIAASTNADLGKMVEAQAADVQAQVHVGRRRCREERAGRHRERRGARALGRRCRQQRLRNACRRPPSRPPTSPSRASRRWLPPPKRRRHRDQGTPRRLRGWLDWHRSAARKSAAALNFRCETQLSRGLRCRDRAPPERESPRCLPKLRLPGYLRPGVRTGPFLFRGTPFWARFAGRAIRLSGMHTGSSVRRSLSLVNARARAAPSDCALRSDRRASRGRSPRQCDPLDVAVCRRNCVLSR